MYNLFLDDLREPNLENYLNVDNFIIARSYQEAIQIINEKGAPIFISFDHDLGLAESGLDLAKFLIEKDLDNNGNFLNNNFSYFVHSANPEGKKNIEKLLNNYLKFKNKNKNNLKN